MRISVETGIAAPPQVVFATVSDMARWPEFVRAIERLEILTPGPVGPGTRFRETRTMFGQQTTEEMTVAAIEPPRRFDLTIENHGMRYLARHEIAATATGARLTMTFEGKAVSLAAKLFTFVGWLFKGAVQKQLQLDLDDVKAEAERRASGQEPFRL